MAKKKKDDAEKILILTQESRTCGQLKNFLTMGGKEFLLYEAMKKLKPKNIQTSNKPESSRYVDIKPINLIAQYSISLKKVL